MTKSIFNKPYPHSLNKWRITISVSLFIAFFIVVFQPFGLSEYQNSTKPF